MDTLDFLRHVLPEEGMYVTTVINDGHPQQAFFGTVEELATNCRLSDKYGNNTYYAISSFKVRGSRKQDNVHLTKVVALDIDCAEGKAYLTQKEGLTALLKFLTATKLPKPMIVSSGRGLHVYWVLNTALPPSQWTPLAQAMKQACIDHDLHADHGLTANSALVLRPTQTHNPKNGAEVRILLAAAPVGRLVLESKLLDFKQIAAAAIAQAAPPKPSGASGLLAALAVPNTIPPAIPAMVVDRCPQVKWAVNNQKDVSEPLWYDLIGIAAYCANPEETAKEWSKQHPDYNEAKTVRKLQQWKANATGPTTCTKIEGDRPKGCKDCKFKDQVGSPAMLGVQRVAIEASADAPDAVAAKLPLPKQYKRVEKPTPTGPVGSIVQIIDGTDIDVCPFEIYPVGYGRDESLGYETVRYKWKRPHVGWQDLSFRQAYLNTDSREFATSTADQGIVLRGKKQLQGFQQMLRAYMEELRKQRTMTNIYGSMGWKENYTQFVIGNRLHRRESDGSVITEEISLNAASNRLGHELYGQQGTVEEWCKGSALVDKAKLPWHNFTLGHSFAAPLWVFTGLKGITISLWGPSGGGKSLIQMWQQSIWGHPEKLHFAAKFTQNALFSRLGLYCHLPMTIDETTMMPDKEVGDFCYWVTQGRDKARLNRKAEERDSKEWSTSVTVSTNRSFIAKMVASGLDTDAQMARLLEVTIPKHNMFAKSSAAGKTIFKHITTNYGMVGDAYAKALLRIGRAEILHRIAVATAVFPKLYNCSFDGVERYWEQALILSHVGCQIAKEEGLIDFDYTIGIRWALSQLDALRRSVADNQTNGFKIINEYLNENAANILVIMHTKGLPSTVDQNRLPRGEVKARFDVYRDSVVDKFDKGTVMLVQKPLKQHVSAFGYDYSLLQKEIKVEGINATPAGKRFWLGRNTGLKLGQQYVIGINLNHPEFIGHLEDIEQTSGGHQL
jgi:hypothetical protein|tara:strand:- start:372 stop:3236 length:2865 start_codon:yes stop_codon:yes gene_type:complete